MILASEVPIWLPWHAWRPLGASQKDASTWARTRDLSVNSRALCQLSHGGISEDAIRPQRCRGGVGAWPATKRRASAGI